MATETDFLKDQNQRLSEIVRQCQMENFSKYSSVQRTILKGDGDDTLVNSEVDQSFLAFLITEYDKHLSELGQQLKNYQKQMGEMKLQLENVIKENERLHSELKDAVEKQLDALPFSAEIGNDTFTDDKIVRNLQQQLQLANQEKTQAVELWQNVSQELNRLQKLYQEHMTEAQIHVYESQKQKTNQHFVKAVTEQNVELDQLRKQLRQAKSDLRVAVAKVEELTKVTENLQEDILKKEEDVVSAQRKEEASDRRLQQLQCSMKQIETRLCVTIQEADQLRSEKTHLEKQTIDLKAKCSQLENEKYDAICRARDSMQLLEEVNIQTQQALIEKKQREDDKEKMRETLSQFIQESALRTRKEVRRFFLLYLKFRFKLQLKT